MKKKIILVVAIVLVVAISAVALVSCASSPSKFYENFKNAKSFTFETNAEGAGSVEVICNGNNASIITKDKDGNIETGMVVIITKKTASIYTYVPKTLLTEAKWVKVESSADSDAAKSIIEEAKEYVGVAEISDDNYIKEGEYWYLKGTDGSAIKTTAMKITSNKMESYIVTEKDGKTEYTLVGTLKLSGTVTAPKI